MVVEIIACFLDASNINLAVFGKAPLRCTLPRFDWRRRTVVSAAVRFREPLLHVGYGTMFPPLRTAHVRALRGGVWAVRSRRPTVPHRMCKNGSLELSTNEF